MPATSPFRTGATPGSLHLTVDGLSVGFAGRRVLTDLSFTVSAGERTALIGENGSGKSTVLRAVSGLLTPERGSIQAVAAGGFSPRIGLLHQEPPFSSRVTVAEALESAVSALRDAEAALGRAASYLARRPHDPQAATAYATALERAEALGVWEADARTEEMMAGLGLAAVDRDRCTGTLSGGQRARLSLAWLLLSRPDVLLLDEPTNHLDDQATTHLRSVVRTWNGPVLFASHDRAFVDETSTSLIDLDPAPGVRGGTVTRFGGTYTDYLEQRRASRHRWEQQYRDEQAELRRLRAAVGDNQQVGHRDWTPRTEVRRAQKFFADRNATVVSRRVNDARARLERLEERQVRKPPAPLAFAGLGVALGAGARRPGGTGPQLSLSGAEVDGRLASTTLSISTGERWLVTGANGCGKSTLLHLLNSDVLPTAGSVGVQPGVTTRLLHQEVHLPDPRRRGAGRTARQAYRDLLGEERAEEVPLATFGLLPARDEQRGLRHLSTGQRRRLALAVVLADPPDVLLLDEPTNHLSLLLVTELEEALVAYPGSVVIASHDRWLRERWEGSRLALRPWTSA